MGKRLSKTQLTWLTVTVFAAWGVLGLVGGLIGAVLAPDGTRLASVVVGCAFGSIAWVIACRITVVVLRRALLERGYELPPTGVR